MPLYVKNKNRKTAYTSLIFALAIGMNILGWFDLRPVFGQAITPSIKQISLSASLFNAENRIIPNGTYEVRFGIYTKNRDTADPYPSNADTGSRLWEETQTVTVKNGIFRAFLGSVTPFPASINFETGDYYIGMRIGTDSEMVPRKQLGSVPSAINAQFLQGRTIGTTSGNIPILGNRGKLNIKNLPTGTGDKQLVLGNDSRLQDAHQQNTDTGTDAEVFNLGSGTAISCTNFDLTVSSSATPPALRYNGTTQAWQLSNNGSTFSDILSGSAGISGTGTNGYVAYWTGTDSLGSEATLATSRGGTGLDGSAAANGSLLIGNGSGYTLATLVAGSAGLTVTNGAGSVTLDVDTTTTGTTATTSSNSGLETMASGIRLLGGCSNDQVLAWSTSSVAWVCSNKTGGTSDWTSSGSVTYLTDTTDNVAFGGSTSTSSRFFFDVTTGNQILFEGTGADDTSETALVVTNPTADRTITFGDASGTVLLSSTTLLTLAGTSGSNQTLTSGDTLTIAAGTGITTTGGATDRVKIAATLGTSVDFTSEVTGVLPIANGGTNKALTLAAGAVVWTDADSFEVTAAGTSGQALISGGTTTPTWYAPTAGSVLFAGTSGILQQDNANFFWDDTNNRLGIGDTTPDASLDVDLSSTSTTAADEYGSYFTVSDTGVVTTGTDNTYGNYIDVTRTGASGGSIDSYGIRARVTADTGGSSDAHGLHMYVIGADRNVGANIEVVDTSTSGQVVGNWGTYVAVTDSGVVTTGSDTNTGQYIIVNRTGATGGTIANYGINASVTGDTGGTSTNYGLYVNASA